MTFEEVKKIVLANIDKAKTLNDLIQLTVDTIYMQGMKDAKMTTPKGEWVKKKKKDTTYKYELYTTFWCCSVCGKEYEPCVARAVNYCYQCGADMRGGT